MSRSGGLGAATWNKALFECLHLEGGITDRDLMLTTTYVDPGPGLDALRNAIREEWTAIKHLANGLLSSGTLTSSEVEELISGCSVGSAS